MKLKFYDKWINKIALLFLLIFLTSFGLYVTYFRDFDFNIEIIVLSTIFVPLFISISLYSFSMFWTNPVVYTHYFIYYLLNDFLERSEITGKINLRIDWKKRIIYTTIEMQDSKTLTFSTRPVKTPVYLTKFHMWHASEWLTEEASKRTRNWFNDNKEKLKNSKQIISIKQNGIEVNHKEVPNIYPFIYESRNDFYEETLKLLNVKK